MFSTSALNIETMLRPSCSANSFVWMDKNEMASMGVELSHLQRQRLDLKGRLLLTSTHVSKTAPSAT